VSEQSTDRTNHPTCDHRDHDAGDEVPAVAQYERVLPPAGPCVRYWACPDHEPEGAPALHRVDPGPGDREKYSTENQQEGSR
jgi:hypothetical protein